MVFVGSLHCTACKENVYIGRLSSPPSGYQKQIITSPHPIINTTPYVHIYAMETVLHK